MWYSTAGIAVASLTGLGPGLMLTMALLALTVFVLRHPRTRRWRWPRAVALVVAGLAWGQYHVDRALDDWLPPSLSGIPIEVEGRVADLPVTDALGPGGMQRSRFQLADARVLQALPDGQTWPGRHRLTLTFNYPTSKSPDDLPQIRGGDQLRLTVRLFPPRGWVNEGSFDRARLDLARGIAARGTVQTLVSQTPQPDTVTAWRERLSERLRERLADHPLAQRILPALVTADRRGMTDSDWAVLQRTGTAHLMAISGLHITLVAGLVWLAARWLMTPVLAIRGQSAARWAVLPAMVVALGYTVLAGFGLPARRALIMTTVGLAALATRQPVSLPRVLLIALALVLSHDPLAVLDNGFWLSFGAVALLGLCRAGSGLVGLLRAQWVLSLGLGAFSAWLFGVWGWVGPLANLVLVPVFSLFLVPLLLCGALLPWGGALLSLSAWLLDACWLFLAGLEHVNAMLPPPGGLLAVALVIIASLLLVIPRLPWPRGVVCPLLLILLLPWLWPLKDRPAYGDFDLVVFDVGQGQAVAVRTRRQLVLYDMGPGWTSGDAGRSVVAPWLRRQRLPVTLAFVSHGDLDHAGGLASLMPWLGRAPVLSGEPFRTPGTVPCDRGQHWYRDGVRIEVLWPVPDIPLREANNRSCVVRISGRHGAALLTGDIYHAVEFALIEQEALSGALRADLLLVPHHGSATSSSYAFLRAVDPRWALASAGYANRHGHPAAHIRERYGELGIAFRVSYETGMIVFPMRGFHNPAPLLWRERFPVAWRPAPTRW
ncbi:MAG: DNA internalization-related competence protein ComEC/Rec2 [Alcanivorax sp.]|nr:DNA internalization-related competence protein ComEC/Rec2 [Alcanivorax sp.]